MEVVFEKDGVQETGVRARETTVMGAKKDDDKGSGYVVPKTLVAFTAGLDEDIKKDVLNLLTLASLAATNKFNSDEQLDKWYEMYFHILQTFGVTLQGSSFSEFDKSGTSVDVDAVVIKVMTAITTENERTVIETSLEALKVLDEDSKPEGLMSYIIRQTIFKCFLAQKRRAEMYF